MNMPHLLRAEKISPISGKANTKSFLKSSWIRHGNRILARQFSIRNRALTVTGARKVLIAYNVNLNTDNQKLAHEISLRIRESGRMMKDRYGKHLKNERGEAIKIAGTLKSVKAMGVFLERFNIAQVSINLVDYETTSMHDVFEEVKKQALSLNIEATGSELVGLAPLEALLKAGRFYAGGKKYY